MAFTLANIGLESYGNGHRVHRYKLPAADTSIDTILDANGASAGYFNAANNALGYPEIYAGDVIEIHDPANGTFRRLSVVSNDGTTIVTAKEAALT